MNTGYLAGEEWSFSAVHNILEKVWVHEICLLIHSKHNYVQKHYQNHLQRRPETVSDCHSQAPQLANLGLHYNLIHYLPDFNTYMKAYHKGVQIDTVSEDM